MLRLRNVFYAISGWMDGLDWMEWVGWDLCVGLLYEHRFAVLISNHNHNCTIRFLHDPKATVGFVGCALFSNMFRIFKTEKVPFFTILP